MDRDVERLVQDSTNGMTRQKRRCTFGHGRHDPGHISMLTTPGLTSDMLFIIIDAHLKWLEVYPTKTETATVTIDKLRWTFTTHGLPDTLASDNGSVFTSISFSTFMQRCGIKHVRSAPYHPATNGVAARAEQTVKQGLTKTTKGTINERVTKFLLQYRITNPTHHYWGTSVCSAHGKAPEVQIRPSSPQSGYNLTAETRKTEKGPRSAST